LNSFDEIAVALLHLAILMGSDFQEFSFYLNSPGKNSQYQYQPNNFT